MSRCMQYGQTYLVENNFIAICKQNIRFFAAVAVIGWEDVAAASRI